MTYNVVVTGGAASGKSLVADFFFRLGAKVIDTDKIARDLTSEKGDAIDAIKKEFGTQYIENNTLKRSKMRDLVFNDLTNKKKLEAILHPMIKSQTHTEIMGFNQQDPSSLVVIQIPLFYETGSQRKAVDVVLTVESQHNLQIQRLVENRGLSISMAKKIIANQAKPYQRLRVADLVINNNSSINELQNATKYHYYQIHKANRLIQ